MDFFYLKALHIIFVITWFSGMFYLCRLFIYNREALDKPEPEKGILQRQFAIMIKRLLFGITWPSAILTLIVGIWLLFKYPIFPVWLQIKLGLVLMLYLYHLSLHFIYLQQRKGVFKYNSNQLRIWNEVPTVFLMAIVLLAVVKQNISLLYGFLGLMVFTLLIYLAIRIYRKLRE